MAYIILPHRWLRQPTYPALVDRAHPLAGQLRSYMVMINGVPWDAVLGRPCAWTGTKVVTTKSDGHGNPAQFIEDTSTVGCTSTVPSAITTNSTLFAQWYKNVETTTQKSIISLGTPRFSLMTDAGASAGSLRATYDGSPDGFAQADGVVSAGPVFTAATTFYSDSGSYPALYLNGFPLTPTTTQNIAGSINSAVTVVRYATDSNALELEGGVSVGGWWTRILSDADVRALHENPYQMLVPLQRRIWVPSAGVGGQTLTPTKFTNTSTFGTPVISVGAVTLTPTKFTNTSTFGAPVVTPGAVTLTPTKFTNTNTFGSHTVTFSTTLSPTKFTNTSTFGTPVITVGGVTLTCSIFVNQSTFGTHILTGGAVVSTQQPAGRPSKRKYRKPVVVEIDGEDFFVRGEAEAEDLLVKAKQVAEEKAKSETARIIAKRKTKAKVKHTEIDTQSVWLDAPEIKAADDASSLAFAARLREEFDAIYKQAAMEAELRLHMMVEAAFDEDDSIALLLL